jgi:iron complex outermembrane receptor protein
MVCGQETANRRNRQGDRNGPCALRLDRAIALALCVAALAPCQLAAQDAMPPVSAAANAPPSNLTPPKTTTLPAVKVNASRMAVSPFDLPAALTIVNVEPTSAANPGVNLSETLAGVPGIIARDRQNYAQDEQISIRGFGGRATFGVRSIRLYIDGIPATLPDGQGQVSPFNIDSADRVEVLRGPFSVLYGNAAGGVVQMYSADGTAVPQTTLGFSGGSNDTFRYSADTRGIVGPVDYNIAASEFLSGGYRQHSRVHRESDNAKFGIDLGKQRKLTVVLNRFYQPVAQDALGLTRAQVNADPRQATAVASQFNTRKSSKQTQLGLIYEQQIDENDQVRAMVYHGQRSILQYQAIPVATQKNPLQSGGVVQPDTDYGGTDLRWTHSGDLLDRDVEFVLGLSADYQHQRRLGFNNFITTGGVTQLGVVGALRRNENDDVDNVDEYAQWYWHFADRWSLLLGLRRDDVHFHEQDFYITATNPNDSGRVTYSATTPVAGVQFRPADNLQPQHSKNLEVGAKWQIMPALEFDAAAFRADTRNELTVDTNENGRATYQNVGSARRQGLEFSLTGQLGNDIQLSAGFTHLLANFRSAFLTCTTTPCAVPTTPVAAGTPIPGVPGNYGSLRLEHGTDLGWREGLTLQGVGAVTVNDTDTQHAAGYGLIDIDTSYTFALGATTRLQLTASIDNLADRRYIGTVIVNDSNGRYFEPGPDRTYMLGARLTF